MRDVRMDRERGMSMREQKKKGGGGGRRGTEKGVLGWRWDATIGRASRNSATGSNTQTPFSSSWSLRPPHPRPHQSINQSVGNKGVGW